MSKKESTAVVVKENTMLSTIKDPNTGKEVLNFKALTRDVHEKITAISNGLLGAMKDYSLSRLRIGEYLAKGQVLLEGQGLFIAWINTIPGMNKATAYRAIHTFENAKKLLPPHVAQLALSVGKDIVGSDEDEPWGKFAKAVTVVGEPPKSTGNKQEDDAQALQWINEVTTVQGQEHHKATRGKKDYAAHVKMAVRGVIQHYSGVENKQQTTFIRDVFGYVLTNVSLPEMTVKPKDATGDMKITPKKAKKVKKTKKESE